MTTFVDITYREVLTNRTVQHASYYIQETPACVIPAIDNLIESLKSDKIDNLIKSLKSHKAGFKLRQPIPLPYMFLGRDAEAI
jgi:hypothetical protein